MVTIAESDLAWLLVRAVRDTLGSLGDAPRRTCALIAHHLGHVPDEALGRWRCSSRARRIDHRRDRDHWRGWGRMVRHLSNPSGCARCGW